MLTPVSQAERLLRRGGFLTLEHVARVDNGGRIDRDVSFVDVLNDSVFIDHESSAISEALFFIEDAIVFDHSAFEITEYREGNSDLFCEFAVGGNTVNTHAEDLRVGGFEFGDISLIRLQLLRSTTGEREHINRQYDILLAFEIAQLVLLSVSSAKLEVGGFVTDLQMCFGRSRLLGQRHGAEDSKQPEGCQQSFVHKGLLASRQGK